MTGQNIPPPAAILNEVQMLPGTDLLVDPSGSDPGIGPQSRKDMVLVPLPTSSPSDPLVSVLAHPRMTASCRFIMLRFATELEAFLEDRHLGDTSGIRSLQCHGSVVHRSALPSFDCGMDQGGSSHIDTRKRVFCGARQTAVNH